MRLLQAEKDRYRDTNTYIAAGNAWLCRKTGQALNWNKSELVNRVLDDLAAVNRQVINAYFSLQ
jgi:hypothetical protein